MSKNNKSTSKDVSSLAGSVLADPNASVIQKLGSICIGAISYIKADWCGHGNESIRRFDQYKIQFNNQNARRYGFISIE